MRKKLLGFHGERERLLLEDLQHGFIFGPIHLRQCLRDERPIFETTGMKHFIQSKRGMPKKNFSVFEPLVVIGHREVHSVRDFLDLFQKVAGFVDIARRILAHTEFGHLVDQLSIEKTLLARLSLRDFCLQRRNALLIGNFLSGVYARACIAIAGRRMRTANEI